MKRESEFKLQIDTKVHEHFVEIELNEMKNSQRQARMEAAMKKVIENEAKVD